MVSHDFSFTRFPSLDSVRNYLNEPVAPKMREVYSVYSIFVFKFIKTLPSSLYNCVNWLCKSISVSIEIRDSLAYDYLQSLHRPIYSRISLARLLDSKISVTYHTHTHIGILGRLHRGVCIYPKSLCIERESPYRERTPLALRDYVGLMLYFLCTSTLWPSLGGWNGGALAIYIYGYSLKPWKFYISTLGCTAETVSTHSESLSMYPQTRAPASGFKGRALYD